MARRRVKVFFDGGCRPNPGPMEAAVVVRGVEHLFDDLGTGTNTDAEWLALILALELSQAAGLADVELIGDAVEVTRQANAVLASRQAPHRHAARFLALAIEAPPARVRWIKREQNLAGIALAARHPR
ncbi:ribonuclease HI [Novosphingobium mangrovi (ex Huang et al. 2023)]|uniref:Reverse transcriptase-like protein n=1 Tax=Novosphingobium mangrovi (ex Huang et al. 2023) TaxID=2976432 RepID=A0ABT2I1C6_9SPHN|nr:reverse transcriptase-like protein [Novosphingobium mangrovi (ex Huang et al. 2023)]MCT2398458.1 reverse transcriptase-like protein [Novosphingobium mangrovi (ex Huang et al. 2023)]